MTMTYRKKPIIFVTPSRPEPSPPSRTENDGNESVVRHTRSEEVARTSVEERLVRGEHMANQGGRGSSELEHEQKKNSNDDFRQKLTS